MSLEISPKLRLPDEAVTQTFAILAKRGAGKTYTASVMVEEMLKNNLPVVVVDPIGVWFGLRSSADGKKAGLPIIIAGGDHADVPIEPTSGEVLAELIVNNKMSIVIDLSLFRKGEQKRFMTDFAETLYHRNRGAVHLVLDEADTFAPQRPLPGDQRMLGAMEDLVRKGRARGIGVTMITQRPAVLNKDVLTQIEVLVALRLTAPIDQKAIDEWIKTHADEDQRAEFMASLPSLPIGTAWFWSPGWLNLFQRVEVRKRETLDSSSTPLTGKEIKVAKKMADVDLDKIRKELSTTIEKIESEDPKLLRRRIVELEKKLAAANTHPVVQVKKVPVVTDQLVEDLYKLFDNFKSQPVFKALTKLQATLDEIVEEKKQASPLMKLEAADYKYLATKPNSSQPIIIPADRKVEIIDGEIGNYAKSLLETMGRHYPMKLTRSQISTLSGRKPRSSAFSAAMADIVRLGYAIKSGDQYELTARALHEIDTNVATQSSEELIQTWLNALPPYESDLLEKLVSYYPQVVTREQLANLTNRSLTSSGFHGAISSLKKNGLIETVGNGIRANDSLFMSKVAV